MKSETHIWTVDNSLKSTEKNMDQSVQRLAILKLYSYKETENHCSTLYNKDFFLSWNWKKDPFIQVGQLTVSVYLENLKFILEFWKYEKTFLKIIS